MSTKASPNSLSCVAVAGLPLTHARLLPCRSTVRRNSSVSKWSNPASSSHAANQAASVLLCAEDPSVTSNSAVTSKRFAPSRTKPASARAPNTSCTASIKIDLPAPVSPVNTVKPLAKPKSNSRTMTKSRSAKLFKAMPRSPPRSNAVFCATYQNSSNLWDAKSTHCALNVSSQCGRQC